MRAPILIGFAAGLLFSGVKALCSGALMIDDFSRWPSHTNCLNSWTSGKPSIRRAYRLPSISLTRFHQSDDGSMISIFAAGGTLSFQPKEDSHIYEMFPCQTASSWGYSSVQFTIKGPIGGSLNLKMETQASCSGYSSKSHYYTIKNLIGETQTITVPFTAFGGANGDAVTNLCFEEFSNSTTIWELSKLRFGCGGDSENISSSSESSIETSTSGHTLSASIRPTSDSASTNSNNGSSTTLSTHTSSTWHRTNVTSIAQPTSSSTWHSVNTSTTWPPTNNSSTRSTITSTRISSTPRPSPTGFCGFLVEDFASPDRLKRLEFNALGLHSSGDFESLEVGIPSANRVTITPPLNGFDATFYTGTGCKRLFPENAFDPRGGISLRIKAPEGTHFDVELEFSCNMASGIVRSRSTTELGWTFDGTEQLYTADISQFSHSGAARLNGIRFKGFTSPISLSPIAMYCDYPQEWPPTNTSTTTPPTPSPTKVDGLVLDRFTDPNVNEIRERHGKEDDGMQLTWGVSRVRILSPDPEYAFYSAASSVSDDWDFAKDMYLHIAYSGIPAFSIGLWEDNSMVNDAIFPWPVTWNSLEASRYAINGHIYIPISHFNIELGRVIKVTLHGFYLPTTPVTLSVIEIVPRLPEGVITPPRLKVGRLVFNGPTYSPFCSFGIEEGTPALLRQTLDLLRKENVPVTFFPKGQDLLDPATANVYRDAVAQGHQIGLYSYTGVKLEGLPDYDSIDREIDQNISVLKSVLNVTSKYLRPPGGAHGARMRQRLAMKIQDPIIAMWGIDPQSFPPEKQRQEFIANATTAASAQLIRFRLQDQSSISLLRDFITIVKETATPPRTFMRLDTCMYDPESPVAPPGFDT